VLFLRLREAVLDGGTRVIEIAQRPTATTGLAAATLMARPGDAPALARALTGDDSGMAALRSHPEGAACPPATLDGARRLLAELTGAERAGTGPSGTGVVVVLGRPSLAEAAGITAEAAQVLAAAWPGATFLPALRRGNVHGALDMGLAPGVLPGRVSLERGSPTFAAAWGTVPGTTGRDATATLASLAGDGGADEGDDGPVRALILLGADPLRDFPDRALAERALSAAEHVVAVGGHASASLVHADVVLPAAVAHERSGTTTNIEGRVSHVAQKMVPPGQAWPDWMIAAELAVELGGDLEATSLSDLSEEIDRLAPAYAGIHGALTASAVGGGDGVVAPLGHLGTPAAVTRPIDPIALPGVESAELQGAPARVGRAEPPDFEEAAAGVAGAGATAGWDSGGGNVIAVRVPQLADGSLPSVPGLHVGPPDSYSLRLVAPRRLYDAGSAVAGSPSLRALVPSLRASANPYDLDRLGLGTGDRVRVRSARGSLELEALADPGIPRGVVSIDFNVPLDGSFREPGVLGGPSNAVATLIDAAGPVTEVRLESV
jgi:NADH-quinone oxidoreductase subunit G